MWDKCTTHSNYIACVYELHWTYIVHCLFTRSCNAHVQCILWVHYASLVYKQYALWGHVPVQCTYAVQTVMTRTIGLCTCSVNRQWGHLCTAHVNCTVQVNIYTMCAPILFTFSKIISTLFTRSIHYQWTHHCTVSVMSTLQVHIIREMRTRGIPEERTTSPCTTKQPTEMHFQTCLYSVAQIRTTVHSHFYVLFNRTVYEDYSMWP